MPNYCPDCGQPTTVRHCDSCNAHRRHEFKGESDAIDALRKALRKVRDEKKQIERELKRYKGAGQCKTSN